MGGNFDRLSRLRLNRPGASFRSPDCLADLMDTIERRSNKAMEITPAAVWLGSGWFRQFKL